MVKVIFVCLGNICRSPTAELVFKKIVRESGRELSFEISSRATSDEEEGNPIYPPAAKTLAAHGIEGEHRAQRLTKKDVINADYILVMDSGNLFDVLRLTSGAYGEKIFKLCSFTSNPRDIADPWITRDFERAFNDIYDGCLAFFQYLLNERAALLDYDQRH